MCLIIWALTGTLTKNEAGYVVPVETQVLTSQITVAEEPVQHEFTLVSVGDIMMHSDEISSGFDRQTKTYDYRGMFEEVKPYLEAGDITIGNLEFVMAGEKERYTGYPMFNAPSEVADAIKAAGVDVLTTANNHSLDRYFKGVEHTIDVLDHRGLLHTGTYKTEEASLKPLIMESDGIKIAFLAYTYGTNGLKTDKDKTFSVNYINKEKIKSDIVGARKAGADLVCVSMHFGTEYQREPVPMQKDLVTFLAENGVDIILGGHPHVLEPMEIRKVTVDGKAKEVVILYSQGNFISGQRGRYVDTGAIFYLTFHKEGDQGEVVLEGVRFIPTWVDTTNAKGHTQFRVLPSRRAVLMYEGGKDEALSSSDYTKLKRSLSDAREILRATSEKASETLTYAD